MRTDLSEVVVVSGVFSLFGGSDSAEALLPARAVLSGLATAFAVEDFGA